MTSAPPPLRRPTSPAERTREFLDGLRDPGTRRRLAAVLSGRPARPPWPPELTTRAELAARCGVAVADVDRLIDAQHLPLWRVGHRELVDTRPLGELIDLAATPTRLAGSTSGCAAGALPCASEKNGGRQLVTLPAPRSSRPEAVAAAGARSSSASRLRPTHG